MELAQDLTLHLHNFDRTLRFRLLWDCPSTLMLKPTSRSVILLFYSYYVFFYHSSRFFSHFPPNAIATFFQFNFAFILYVPNNIALTQHRAPPHDERSHRYVWEHFLSFMIFHIFRTVHTLLLCYTPI